MLLCEWLQSLQWRWLSKLFNPAQHIKLSVGGSIFVVSREEMLEAGSAVLTEVINAGPCPDGEYFLDRDGTHFQYILDFIRHGESALSEISSGGERQVHISYQIRKHLLLEAKKLGLADLHQALNDLQICTPHNSGSGYQARHAIESEEYCTTHLDSCLFLLPNSEERERLGFAKCLACCNPISITIVEPLLHRSTDTCQLFP